MRLGYFTIVADTRLAAEAAAKALVTEGGFAGHAAAYLSQAELASLANFQSSSKNGWTYLTVNSTADPGDGVCDATECTLREAITAANSAAGPAMIVFGFPQTDPGHVYYRDDGIAGSLSLLATTDLADDQIADFDPDYPLDPFNWFRIQVASPLPAITNSVVIDGFSQTGARANAQTPDQGMDTVLRVELDGSLAGAAAGLQIGSSDSAVRGLVINRFGSDGIQLVGQDNDLIEGNFLGTDATGTIDRGNANHGVRISDGAQQNVLRGNLISGNRASVR